MIIINGLKNCDTCRKAVRALTDAGMECTLRDFRATPVSADELDEWLRTFGDALMNTRSTTWRGLSDDERSGAPLNLMLAHPALIKRPVVVAGDALHLGWTPATRSALGLD